jgi:hypothetical protein
MSFAIATPGDSVSLDQALADIIDSVPGCVATGWVDMDTGVLLGVRGAAPPHRLDRAHGVSAEHYFRELAAPSQHTIHMFACRTRDQVLVVVTRMSANLRAVIARTRAVLSAVEAVS